MTGVIQLGPLMLAADRLLTVVLLMLFTFAIGKIGERTGRETGKAALGALVAGIVASRLAYVARHWSAHSQDWLSAFALWQGGFSAWAGIITAAAVLVAMLGCNRTSGYSLGALAALALVWTGVNVLLASPPWPLPRIPALATLDGERIEPARLLGRPFVINLWATWCPPCRRELPMLAEIAAGSEVPVLLVNHGEPAGQVVKYLAQVGVAADAIVLDERRALARIIGGGALPTTLFVNAHGQVIRTHVGEISRAALLEGIVALEQDSTR